MPLPIAAILVGILTRRITVSVAGKALEKAAGSLVGALVRTKLKSPEITRVFTAIRKATAPTVRFTKAPTKAQVRFGIAAQAAARRGLKPGTRAFGRFMRDELARLKGR